jgi:hypothetical protein
MSSPTIGSISITTDYGKSWVSTVTVSIPAPATTVTSTTTIQLNAITQGTCTIYVPSTTTVTSAFTVAAHTFVVAQVLDAAQAVLYTTAFAPPLESSVNPTSGQTSQTSSASASGQSPKDSSSPTTSTTSSVPVHSSSTTAPSSKRLSAGAAAGVGVGSAIFGALIVLLLGWCFLGRKREGSRSRQAESAPASNGKYKDLESPQSLDAMLLGAVHDLLPQPLSQTTISSEMSQLGTKIKAHATNFYSLQAVDLGARNSETLSGIAMGQRDPSNLWASLASSEGREAAIRYVIARKIFECIQVNGEPSTTFLPASVVALQRDMPDPATGDGKHSILISKFHCLNLTTPRSFCSPKQMARRHLTTPH